jgi:hypothetical protein
VNELKLQSEQSFRLRVSDLQNRMEQNAARDAAEIVVGRSDTGNTRFAAKISSRRTGAPRRPAETVPLEKVPFQRNRLKPWGIV